MTRYCPTVRSHYSSVAAIQKFDKLKHDMHRPIELKISPTDITVILVITNQCYCNICRTEFVA